MFTVCWAQMARQSVTRRAPTSPTTTSPTTTMASPNDAVIGYAACVVASVFFGSNYVVVYGIDGHHSSAFFAACMSAGIAAVGALTAVARGVPQFEPHAALGGAAWASGNVVSALVISKLGAGAAISIWGGVCLVIGWASARFGAFGAPAPTSSSVANGDLNALGVVIAVLSIALSACVATEDGDYASSATFSESEDVEREVERLLGESDDDGILGGGRGRGAYAPLERGGGRGRTSSVSDIPTISRRDDERQWKRNAPYVALAAASGVLYGVNFNPVEALRAKAKSEGHSEFELDYVPSHFCGIFLASMAYFAAYVAYHVVVKRRSPMLASGAGGAWAVVAPAVASGAMWGVAQTSWFVANEHLSLLVTFPIISCAPGAIASLWDMFYFKKLTSQRNRALLVASNAARVVAVACIVKSSA